MKQKVFLFGALVISTSKHIGWCRLFGVGVKWSHISTKPLFSERIGKRKTVTLGNYRFGYLKQNK